MATATVVGSGPNGLTAACVLAQAGVQVTVYEAAETIGGGTRTSELTLPGLLHDHCSAVHPMGAGSPVFKALQLEQHGLEWLWPKVDLAHVLDGGRAGVMVRDINATIDGFERVSPGDGRAWRRMFSRSSKDLPTLYEDVLVPLFHMPRHPLGLVPFGLSALAPAALTARVWDSDEAKGLFAGVAAHGMRPFTSIGSAAVGMALISACHADGWPVARGGSRSITDAMASKLTSLGGRIETGRRISSLHECRPADLILLDVSPANVIDLAGDELPGRVATSYRRFKHGPGAWKVDLAVDGGVPWTNETARIAGTVHVGGTIDEVARSEADASAGRMTERPFVLVAQQAVPDPSRAAGDVVPIWAYCHVPNGYDGDATPALLNQIERFAPGFRERILATAVRTPREFESYDTNFIGGDIGGGANSLGQLIARPRLSIDPYSTGIPGVYLCSASTPPAGGVHGMCGWNATQLALRWLQRHS